MGPPLKLNWKLCYDRRSVGQSILASGLIWGPRHFFTVRQLRPFWREDGSVIYNFCWLSLAQSFSCSSPAGLMAIFYCLRFETPSTWRARSRYLYPAGRCPSYASRHLIPFSSPPTTRRATMEVFEPASTRGPQSQSYFTTGGLPSISSSWHQASWGSQPQIFLILFYSSRYMASARTV
jgi:hypothetical protein